MENIVVIEEELRAISSIYGNIIKELNDCNDFQKLNTLQLEIIDLKSEINILENKLSVLRDTNDYHC